jgi:hypothetical protein
MSSGRTWSASVVAGARSASLGRLPHAWVDRAQRLEHERPEAHRVVVVLVQRQPREGTLLVLGGRPLAEQRGLARAGRRGQERQLALAGSGQQPDQRLARHAVDPRRGDVELGGDEDTP